MLRSDHQRLVVAAGALRGASEALRAVLETAAAARALGAWTRRETVAAEGCVSGTVASPTLRRGQRKRWIPSSTSRTEIFRQVRKFGDLDRLTTPALPRQPVARAGDER